MTAPDTNDRRPVSATAEAPLLLTATQAAALLSISRTTLYELLASGATWARGRGSDECRMAAPMLLRGVVAPS